MRTLILTKEEYVEFISSIVKPYMKDHLIYVYDTTEPFIFGFDDLRIEYDVGISFMYTHKVPREELNVPWFNFHPAPLPGYKGRDLCYHAIMEGATEFGATLHYMDEDFDTGDIIDVQKINIQDWWNAQDLSEYAINISRTLFMHYFPLILEARVFPRIPNVGGTYYKKGDIIEEIPVKPDEPFGQFVRAVSFPSKGFHPRIDIGGVKYEIRRME